MFDAEPRSSSRYQVITTLGQGGMARVTLTMARGPAGVTKLLVVKELRDELKVDPEFVTMFLDEARIAARLNHPNVIQTYEVSSDGEHPVIVMEYLEGQALSTVLARVGRKKMPLDLHLYVLSQTAAGLHYAHELKNFDGTALGLVHRDVSPHNVFVTYDGRVLLVDFGIAKAADSAGLTRAGTFKGKVGYASPEQLAAHAGVDRRADVFALGVMLWEALASRRLAHGELEAAVMHRRLAGGDPKIRDVAPDAPEELCRICEKAMAHAPADRYATAAELRAAIDAYLETSKRVGAEDIGALVRETFAADREKVRALVEQRIRDIQAQTTTAELPAAPASLRTFSEPPPPSRRDAREPGDSTVKVTTVPSASAAPPVPPEAPSSRKAVLIGAVVGAAVIAFAVAGGLRRDPAPDRATAAPGAEGAPAATVDVWISAEPREARIYLDDTVLAQNPFRGGMARSTLTRKLRVSAPGFTTDERLVTLDRDMHLELSLKPAQAAAPPSKSAAPSVTATAAAASGPVAHAPSTSAAPSVTAAAPATAPPAKTSGPAPGDALTGPDKKKTRTIDTTF